MRHNVEAGIPTLEMALSEFMRVDGECPHEGNRKITVTSLFLEV